MISIRPTNRRVYGHLESRWFTPLISNYSQWAAEFRSQSKGPFQLNLWIPGPAPARDLAAEKLVREFLATWGPAVLDHAKSGYAGAPGEYSSVQGAT
jgi:hypothetical protein